MNNDYCHSDNAVYIQTVRQVYNYYLTGWTTLLYGILKDELLDVTRNYILNDCS
jgi:hypothetical protein